MLRKTLFYIAFVFGLLASPTTNSARAVDFGVHTPGDPFGGNTRGVDEIQRDTQRKVDVVSWFQNWGGEPWVSQVHPHVFNAVIGSGRTPMVTWEPWTPGGGAWQPRFSLRRIVDGDFDDYITRWARGLRALGATIYLRPMHEMNGNWYPWGGSVNANSPALFKRAWVRMHRIFRDNGARNVRWVFSPVTEDWPMTAANRFERYYPGRAFVDVLALDGYNWGSRKPNFGGWRSFRTTFSSPYRRLSRLGPQPIWVAEVGSATEGGNKASWVREMFRTAARMRRLRTIIWMDTLDADEGDWRVRSPADVALAFRPSRLVASAASLSSLRVPARVRAGRRVIVRWSEMGAGDDVELWRIHINGKRIRTRNASRPRVHRTRMFRPGRYRWTVTGVDVNGTVVASATRSSVVLRSRSRRR